MANEKSRNVKSQGKQVPAPKDIVQQVQQSEKLKEKNRQDVGDGTKPVIN